MSELKNTQYQNSDFRLGLLAHTSMLALLAGMLTLPAGAMASEDDNHPTVWIEVGGQLERVDTPQSILAPPFFELASPEDRAVMTAPQRPSRYGVGEEGKVTFAPAGTDWTFSAAIRYGRSNAARHQHHQTAGLPTIFPTFAYFGVTAGIGQVPRKFVFGDGQANASESHTILDFQAGRDVGLGLFGAGSKAVVSIGVRYAQFASSSDVTLHARPEYGFLLASSPGKYRFYQPFYRNYTAVLHTKRDSHGIGPSVSWDASIPLAGSPSDMTLDFDWGANAAVLFGRQRANVDHQTNGLHYSKTGGLNNTLHYASYSHPAHSNRSHSVTIPNVGGFAGLSLKFPNAKVSLGYRADFFFGAIDNGIDSRKTQTVGFYGPFANVSIGLGG